MLFPPDLSAGLVNNICLPNGLKYIGDSAFQSCKTIENSYIPDQVEVIGKRAFAGCSSLRKINILDMKKIFISLSKDNFQW